MVAFYSVIFPLSVDVNALSRQLEPIRLSDDKCVTMRLVGGDRTRLI